MATNILKLTNALQHEKDLSYWKAKSTEQVKKIAYGNKS